MLSISNSPHSYLLANIIHVSNSCQYSLWLEGLWIVFLSPVFYTSGQLQDPVKESNEEDESLHRVCVRGCDYRGRDHAGCHLSGEAGISIE